LEALSVQRRVTVLPETLALRFVGAATVAPTVVEDVVVVLDVVTGRLLDVELVVVLLEVVGGKVLELDVVVVVELLVLVVDPLARGTTNRVTL
jgi:hypothetical protein